MEMSAPLRQSKGGEVSKYVTRPFRFGVVCPLTTDLRAWRDRVRRIADSGYSTLLMPDVPGWQPAPGPTLALAAELAEMRVGTWVYASPVRPAWTTAWEAHSLSVLSDGRFEMGIGTGRPGNEDQLRELGLPVAPQGARRALDSLAVLPADPAAATEEVQRRREEIGYSYFVFGAGSADTLAPVVAALAGH